MITVHTNNVNCEHHECEQQNQVSTAANKYNLYPGLLYWNCINVFPVWYYSSHWHFC